MQNKEKSLLVVLIIVLAIIVIFASKNQFSNFNNLTTKNKETNEEKSDPINDWARTEYDANTQTYTDYNSQGQKIAEAKMLSGTININNGKVDGVDGVIEKIIVFNPITGKPKKLTEVDINEPNKITEVSYEYDSQNRKTREVKQYNEKKYYGNILQKTVTITYNPEFEKPTTIKETKPYTPYTSSENKEIKYEYDESGNKSKESEYEENGDPKLEIEYYSNGKKRKESKYKPKHKLDEKFEYDLNERRIKEIKCEYDGYYSNGDLKNKKEINFEFNGDQRHKIKEIEYNKNNQIIKEIEYNNNEAKLKEIKYKREGTAYNDFKTEVEFKNNRIFKKKYFNQDNQITKNNEYEYDNEGNNLKTKILDSTNKLISTKKYDYTAKEKNNKEKRRNKKTEYNLDNKKIQETEYKYKSYNDDYDGKTVTKFNPSINKKIEIINYDQYNKIEKKIKINYHDNGKTKEQKIYDKNNNIKEEIYYYNNEKTKEQKIYDYYGNIKEEIYYHNNGKKEKEFYREYSYLNELINTKQIEYKYDSNNQKLIEQKEFQNGKQVKQFIFNDGQDIILLKGKPEERKWTQKIYYDKNKNKIKKLYFDPDSGEAKGQSEYEHKMENSKYLFIKTKKDKNNRQINKTVSTYDKSKTQNNDSMDYGFIDNKYLCRKNKTEFNSNNKKVKETIYNSDYRYLKSNQKIFDPRTETLIKEIIFDRDGKQKP